MYNEKEEELKDGKRTLNMREPDCKNVLCEACGTTEEGITEDGRSKYIKHKQGCKIFNNQTSAAGARDI